jgi:hypothetical protein
MTVFSHVLRDETALSRTFKHKVNDKAFCGQQVKHNARGMA